MRALWMVLGTSGCAVLPSQYDLSDRPLPEAIAESLDHLEAYYAFTEHRQLDWDAAREALQPVADEADSARARADAVRQLVTWLPDAHVQLHNDDPDAELCPEAAGDFGITWSDLDDGRVVAVTAGQGIEVGDTLVAWDGRPIDEAREAVAFQCYPRGAATLARVQQVQLILLGRGEVGQTAVVQVERAGALQTVELTAARAATDPLRLFGIHSPKKLIDSRRLPQGPGYIAVGWEATYQAETGFQKALGKLRDAPSLVIDLRRNEGGMERTAANIAGFFTDERDFYETVLFLNTRTGEPQVMSEVWTEPQEIYWNRPTAVLIDAATVSSGEGLAMLLARRPQVEIVAFEGTAASFGSTGSSIGLPDGWVLDFPGGQSLDRKGRIQLDSDETMDGGVHPTIRVPWTLENRVALAAGADPVLDAAVAWLTEGKR